MRVQNVDANYRQNQVNYSKNDKLNFGFCVKFNNTSIPGRINKLFETDVLRSVKEEAKSGGLGVIERLNGYYSTMDDYPKDISAITEYVGSAKLIKPEKETYIKSLLNWYFKSSHAFKNPNESKQHLVEILSENAIGATDKGFLQKLRTTTGGIVTDNRIKNAIQDIIWKIIS